MRLSRTVALLVAPVGVLLGHAFADGFHHAGRAVLAPGLIGAVGLAVCVAVVASTAVAGLVAVSRQATGRGDLAVHLVGQAAVLAGLELLDAIGAMPGLLVALHGPVTWLAVVCQLAAALVVRGALVIVGQAVGRVAGPRRVMRPVSARRLLGPATARTARLVVSPRPIVGRAPPRGDASPAHG